MHCLNRLPLLAMAVLLTLVGCAGTPQSVDPGAVSASQGSAAGATPAVTQPPVKKDTHNAGFSAVSELVAEAKAKRLSGDPAGCLAQLDRALRIAPQLADIYLELARCHSATGRDDRAAAAAQRGMLYCSGSLCRSLRRFSDS